MAELKTEARDTTESNEENNKANTQVMQITVRDGDGGELTFKLKKKTSMKKLMTTYCEKMGVAYGTYRFMLDGKRINEDDTVDTLQLEDGDYIDAFLYQQGGIL
eukprot:jgi/Galph1/2358/GphlegSOOS_G34.1